MSQKPSQWTERFEVCFQVTLTECSRDPDVNERVGSARQVAGASRSRVHRSLNADCQPVVIVTSTTLSLDALWRLANTEMDAFLLERSIAALRPDAAVGEAQRQKKRAASRRSGKSRRAKNQPLIDELSRLRGSHPELTDGQAARRLLGRFGTVRAGDRVKALRALTRRIQRVSLLHSKN